MKLVFFRGGRATNSSSSHSVIIGTTKALTHHEINSDCGEYGWEEFILADRKSKALYLSILLRDELAAYNCGLPDGVDECDFRNGYIDHDSMDHGFEFIGVATPLDLINALAECNDVAIYGGNDNTEYEFLPNESHRLFIKANEGRCFVRKDEQDIVLFFPDIGNLVRLSHDGNHGKMIMPVLVDMKITDHCDQGCAFCYQGSEPNNMHADTNAVIGMIDQMRGNVLEIAFGGGDPLSHPDLSDIIRYTIDCGIMPNITVFGSPRNMDRIVKLEKELGGYASDVHYGISVQSAAQLKRLVNTKDRDHWRVHSRTVWHVVEGITPYKDLKTIIEEGLSVLLLGYKHTGRSRSENGWTSDQVEWILSTSKRLADDSFHDIRISVDTLFAKKHKDVLEEMNVSRKLYSTVEGDTSFYIDMVEWTYAPASYVDKKHFKNMSDANGNFHEMWRSVPVV